MSVIPSCGQTSKIVILSEAKNLVFRDSSVASLPQNDNGEDFCRALGSSIQAPRRFRYTRSTARAAGVTPEMREAWPRDRGRTSLSFSRTSWDNPGTAS